jgi:hypothetical protein
MKQVWLLSYRFETIADCGIDGLFSSEEKARQGRKELCAREGLSKGDYKIEPIPLDILTIDRIAKTKEELHKEENKKTEKEEVAYEYISLCCESEMDVELNEGEGQMDYFCKKCGEPCDYYLKKKE